MTALAYPQILARSQPNAVGRASRAGVNVAVAALAWGALGFGAVYGWGYWPLALACLCCGLAGLSVERDVRRGHTRRAIVVLLAIVGLAAVLQLIPLPSAWLAAISPSTVDLLQRVDPLFAARVATSHSLSIAPTGTLVAIALYGSFAIFLVGLTRLLSLTGARRFAEALACLGVVLALVGIVQKPLYSGRLYGFWTPIEQGDPFGPFVNRNHFAGWMLMALPITLGLLCAGLDRGMRGVKPDLRNRLLWLSSPEANRLILIAGAAIIMALALVMTMSRSGITALALAVLITGAYVVGAGGARSRKVVGAGYLLLLAVTVTGWVGVDAIAERFSKTNWSEFDNRKGAWADALSVAEAFPAFGTGLNTYGVATLFYQRHDMGSHYDQSHNDYLQLAAEGGALVVIPVSLCLVLIVRELRRRLREGRGTNGWWIRAGAATSLVAIALQELLDFSLQIPGNAVLFVAICAIALHEAPERSSRAVQNAQET